MLNKLGIALVLCSLLLSACSNSATESNPNPTNQQQEAGESPSLAPENNQEEEIPPAAEEPDQLNQESAAPEDTNIPVEAPVERNYHMNSNYDIVPSEEGIEKKVVLLTFDDGPKEEAMLNDMLDTLDKYNARAIFFVNGYRVKENPELLKLIHERGHTIGNHSWDHIELKNESKETVTQQIVDVQNIVEDTIGEKPMFFRPPHGAGGDVGKQVAKEHGLLYMTWSNGSLDWTMKASDTNTTEQIIENILSQLHAGSNILMHELPWTAEALEELLNVLQEKGYSFVDPKAIEPEMR